MAACRAYSAQLRNGWAADGELVVRLVGARITRHTSHLTDTATSICSLQTEPSPGFHPRERFYAGAIRATKSRKTPPRGNGRRRLRWPGIHEVSNKAGAIPSHDRAA